LDWRSIENIKNNDMTNLLSFIKVYADARFSWETITPKWKALIKALKEQHSDIIQGATKS
jgi:hypothetical protein